MGFEVCSSGIGVAGGCGVLTRDLGCSALGLGYRRTAMGLELWGADVRFGVCSCGIGVHREM